MSNTEKRFIEIENQSSGECEELEYSDEYIEAKVVSLTRKIHPQDLGEETSKLENTLRQALEEVVAEERERMGEEILREVGGEKVPKLLKQHTKYKEEVAITEGWNWCRRRLGVVIDDLLSSLDKPLTDKE